MLGFIKLPPGDSGDEEISIFRGAVRCLPPALRPGMDSPEDAKLKKRSLSAARAARNALGGTLLGFN